MPYNDSDIPKSIFYSALVGEFLIITLTYSSLLYKDFNEKAVELLNRTKAQGKSLRCRKALSKII